MESFTPKPLILVSYSHFDAEAKGLIARHLRVLGTHYEIETLEDSQISLGNNWYEEIRSKFEMCSVAVLLISPDFINSKLCTQEEVPVLLERRRRDGIMVVPILLRPCVWKMIPWLNTIQMSPESGEPLLQLGPIEQENTLRDIALSIHNHLKSHTQTSNTNKKGYKEREFKIQQKIENRNADHTADNLITPPEQSDNQSTITKKETNAYRLDAAATVDHLGRKCVAQALAQLLREVSQHQSQEFRKASATRRSDPGDFAFLANLHGRWGEGKSSVLNFLKEDLQDEKKGNPWIVIEINAWQHERLNVPWWSILTELSRQVRRQYKRARKRDIFRLWLAEAIWRARSHVAPLLFLGAILLWVASFALGEAATQGFAFKSFGEAFDNSPSAAARSSSVSNWAATTEGIVTTLATLMTAATVLIPFLNAIFLGSARTAKLLTELRGDPMRPMVQHFERLVGVIEEPVVFFIDDLDRCSESYVVDMLQTVQTLYRGAPVIFVIAADRQWICRSYQEQYAKFVDDYEEPGRPLGHLFLEKIFQLSIPMPAISVVAQRTYWDALTKRVRNDDRNAKAENRQRAEALFESATSEEDVLQQLEDRDYEDLTPEVREAAVRNLVVLARILSISCSIT